MAAPDSQSFDNQCLDDRLLHNYSLEQVSMEDWAATPESVKQLVSALLAQQLDRAVAAEPRQQRMVKGEDSAPNNIQDGSPNSEGSYSLTQFLDATSVGIAVHDAVGNLVYVNQAGKDLLTEPHGSVEKAAAISQTFHVYRSTTGQPYPLEELPSSLALAGKKAQADDLELHDADRIVPLEVVANPVFDGDGRVIYVIATVQDITQRRQAEQALVEARLSYQQVVEAQTDFVLRSTPDTSISFANPALCRALGRPLEGIIGYKWIDFADPEDLRDVLRKITELTPTNSSFVRENLDCWGDSSIGWTQWLIQGIFNPQGELVEIQSVGRDITILKQTMTALQESEARFRNITENLPGVVFRYLLRADGSDAAIYMSPGCYDLWEIEASAVKASAKALWEIIHPEDVEKMSESVLKSAQNLEPWFWEWRIITPSGKQKWLQGMGKPVQTPEGNTIWDTIVLDISDRKRVELELHAQQELLQLVFDYMPVMVSTFSQEGEVLMVNRYLEQIIGWTQAEYKTVDVLRECYPDPQDYETIKAFVSKADSTWKEFKTNVRDGRILDTRWMQVRLANGRSMSIGQDITEQKRLIASLAEMNQELELRVAQRTEALEKQGALLQESRKVARLGSWEAIPQTDVVYWSPEMFQLFGYDPSQPSPSLSQQSRNFVPEDWQRLLQAVNRAVNFGEPYELDLQIIREDGSRGYVFGKGQPIFDEGGKVERLIGVAMDISDRKIAEAALAESEAQNRAILQAIPDLMFQVNWAGVYLSHSGSKDLLKSLGNGQVIGQAMKDCLPPELYERQFHYMTVALETRQTQVYEQEIEISGNLQQEEVRIVPIEDKQEVLFMIRDISDRKAAEQEIIRSRDLREAIFNESADALFLVDSETFLTVDCNRRAVELFEATDKADLIGIYGHELQHQRFTDEELKAIAQAVVTQGLWSQELEYLTQQGNIFWGNIAINRILVAGKSMTLVRVTDISDRKRVETRNEKITQKLAAANRELEAFAYSVSHDLRSPLRAIDGFSKALIEDYGDQFDEEAKDYFHRIHRAVERMGSLIDDLLCLSRVSRTEIQHSRVDLTEIAQEIATDLQTSQPDRRVEFWITPGLIVYADSNLLRVALENLLQNAWKFTSHHPTARIEIGTIKTSEIEPNPQTNPQTNSQTAPKPGEETIYFVRDDGAGFDMAYAAMLFGVFQRLHNTNEFPGTGIGLATVQRVIHRHGGRVWAEGVVEAGATIYFTIPYNPD
ncbi:MAG: PAS domain S-box protein [Coleofasciculaceae cyanobacterium SM2_1_6]|nr:PAS domain S-box protein [Coleofasciculaceae cyanobacterium SM2_1_6]